MKEQEQVCWSRTIASRSLVRHPGQTEQNCASSSAGRASGGSPVPGRMRHPGALAVWDGQCPAAAHASCVQSANNILFPGPCAMMHTCYSRLHTLLRIRHKEQPYPDSARQWRLDFESLTPPIRAVAGRGTCCPTTQPSAGRAAAIRRVRESPWLGDLDRLCGHFLVHSQPMAWCSRQVLV